MAMKAKVTAVNAMPAGSAIAVDVDYYDDAAPTVILFRNAFEFPIATTNQAAQNAIIAFGVKVRDSAAAKLTKAQQFVGVEINIP